MTYKQRSLVPGKHAKAKASQPKTNQQLGKERCKRGEHHLGVYPGDSRYMYCVRLCGFAVRVKND